MFNTSTKSPDKLNKFSSLSRSSYSLLRYLGITLMAFHCILSSLSIYVLYYGDKN